MSKKKDTPAEENSERLDKDELLEIIDGTALDSLKGGSTYACFNAGITHGSCASAAKKNMQ